MQIIDAHQHLWDPRLFSYTWMKEIPTLNVQSMIREYRKATRNIGIFGSVYVDTDVDEQDLTAETAMIFSLADQPENRILGIVAGAKLEKERAFSHLAPFWGHPKLKGLRRVLHNQQDEIFYSPTFLGNLAHVSSYGLTFDLCIQSQQLPLAHALIRQFPKTSFILDHCGSPSIRDRQLHPWKENIKALAGEPNVVCKISGLVAYANPDDWSADHFRPFFEHIVESFGWNRILWGGDWPVCTITCSIEQWIKITRALTSEASDSELDALFFRNAQRVYRLQLPTGSALESGDDF
ncbi:amidohydrolase [soil metagenome]